MRHGRGGQPEGWAGTEVWVNLVSPARPVWVANATIENAKKPSPPPSARTPRPQRTPLTAQPQKPASLPINYAIALGCPAEVMHFDAGFGTLTL